MELVLSHAIGSDWETLFDVCIANCQKPLFHKAENSFFHLNRSAKNLKGAKILTANGFESALKTGKIFLEGNASVFTRYLQQRAGHRSIKVCYFGSNIYEDL
jgi:hypothetical protein